MITSEKMLERKTAQRIKALGGWSIKLLSTYISGLPDRLCLMPGGRAFFIEVKTTGKKPTALQKRRHEKLKGLGFEVLVIDKLEQIEKIK